jgi:hypothetical protein
MAQWPYGSQQSPIRIDSEKAIQADFTSNYLVVNYPNEELPE